MLERLVEQLPPETAVIPSLSRNLLLQQSNPQRCHWKHVADYCAIRSNMNSTDDSPQENWRIAEPGSLVERLENELDAKLTAYIEGAITLHDRRVWISDQPYGMKEPSRRLQTHYPLSFSRIHMFDSGSWSQDELRDHFKTDAGQ